MEADRERHRRVHLQSAQRYWLLPDVSRLDSARRSDRARGTRA